MTTINTTEHLHLRRIFRDSLKPYFAPLRGAFKGVRQELGRVDREIARDRNHEARQNGHSRNTY